jgi:dihydropteroate synthase
MIWSLDSRKPGLFEDLSPKFDISIFNSTDLALATDAEMEYLKSSKSGVVLMDRTENGTPEEIRENLLKRSRELIDKGFMKWNLILDPGIGFGKKGRQNLEILEKLEILKETEFPVMVGFSNKKHTRKNHLSRSDF